MLEGLPPNNAAAILRIVCEQGQARAAADAVLENCDAGEVAAAAFATDADDTSSAPWMLEIYLGPKADGALIRAALAGVLGNERANAVPTEPVPERDWIASSLAGLAPVRAGRFLVHGAHDRRAVRRNDVALEIEAALAFGTGHHGTTRGCLLALDALLKHRRPRRVLDLGTGTGILAMAVARVVKRPVRSGDLDPVAVEAAAENARRNGTGPFVRPVVAAGLRHPVLRAGAPYDLVLANILAGPLRALASDIATSMAPGAVLILSGLLAHEAASVLCRFRAHGFVATRSRAIEGWVTLELRKLGRGKGSRGALAHARQG